VSIAEIVGQTAEPIVHTTHPVLEPTPETESAAFRAELIAGPDKKEISESTFAPDPGKRV
jgi:hypothetical protein